jgi:hypothetical protein
MAILAISHVMKSITYKHQNHRFRVFRQSLRIHAFWQFYRYKKNITRIFRIDICRIVGYHRQPSGFLPIWLLISAIFYPAEYRKLARVDVRGNACTVIKKANKKPA